MRLLLFAVCLLAPATAQACVRDRVEDRSSSSPVIVLYNSCDHAVYISGCVLRSQASFGQDTFSPIIQPRSEFLYGLYLQSGESFTYRFRWNRSVYPSNVQC